MGTRLQLQTKLEELLGSENVYYQPSSNLKMEYPCIKYSLSKIDASYADNSAHMYLRCYEITVIDKKPDNSVIVEILKLPMCSYDRHYVADNLNHDTLTLYF